MDAKLIRGETPSVSFHILKLGMQDNNSFFFFKKNYEEYVAFALTLANGKTLYSLLG